MANLPVQLPPGKTVRNIGGTNFLVSKGRRKRFKLPAKTRRKIAASARKMKIPVLTFSALAIPVGLAVQSARSKSGVFNQVKWFGSRMLDSYTGISINPDTGATAFSIKNLQKGLVPLLMLTGIKRLGIFKGVNQALAKTRLPVRLS